LHYNAESLHFQYPYGLIAYFYCWFGPLPL
jgi:hypothetical protein